MATDNVKPIKKESTQSKSLSLENLTQSVNTWRAQKKHSNEPVPQAIWDSIFLLLTSFSESEICRSTGIQSGMLRRKLMERASGFSNDKPIEQVPQKLDFCEAKPAIPLAYKPAKAFDTTTSVVELYRPDGMLMKIHICTDRFEELLRAFFNG